MSLSLSDFYRVNNWIYLAIECLFNNSPAVAQFTKILVRSLRSRFSIKYQTIRWSSPTTWKWIQVEQRYRVKERFSRTRTKYRPLGRVWLSHSLGVNLMKNVLKQRSYEYTAIYTLFCHCKVQINTILIVAFLDTPGDIHTIIVVVRWVYWTPTGSQLAASKEEWTNREIHPNALERFYGVACCRSGR